MTISTKRSRRYPIAEAKARLTRILREVERGTSAELTRRGKPIAAVIPIEIYRKLTGEGGASFVDASEAWRRKYRVQVETLDLHKAFEGLRDRSPGRKAPFG